jgi:spore coat protein A
MSFRFVTAAVASLVTCSPVLADIAILQPVADATIYEDLGTLANGAGDYLFAGNNAGNFSRRALLRFDLTGIPYGSTINSVTLTLTLSRTGSGDQVVSVHRVLTPWNEGVTDPPGNEGGGAEASPGDVTWTHRSYPGTVWATAGADFEPLPSAVAVVGDMYMAYSWSGAGLTADVTGWVNNPASNYGWILLGNETSAQTSKRFDSRTNPTLSARPKLIIDFTPSAPVMGACCLPTGCTVISSTDCANQGGVFQGPGSTCSPDPCTPATGACCLPTGACVVISEISCIGQGGTYHGDNSVCSMISCPVPLTPFVDELPLPGVMQPVMGTPGGAAHYDIAMTETLQQLHRDLPPTRVWTYDGTYPGKTIEARTGLPVTVTWRNDLRTIEDGQLRTTHALAVDTCLHGPDQTGDVPYTVVHLHGGHVPADSDGHPDDAFPPGGSSAVYTYPNNQPAATLWYHDHALGLTRLNVYMGLAGFYLVRDAVEDSLDLPRGQYEVPLAIQDRSFNPDGSLRYPDMYMEHFHGDFAVVNGKVWPYFEVKRGKYRFRVLNGCNSRTLTLALDNGATFWQIGTDGGLLPAPVALTSLTLTPGERADIVVDFAPYPAGTEIILTNSAPAPYPSGGGPALPQIMKFIVLPGGGFTNPLPSVLATVAPIPESEAVEFRELSLIRVPHPPCGGHGTMWTIDGLMWDDITEVPILGTTEVWSFINRSGMSHPMHLHLVQYQILDRQDFMIQAGDVVPIGPRMPPAPNEMGWKDTVRADPWQITRVIARFQNYTGRFPYHCHILEHEDNEMMRQFEVCAPANFTNQPDDAEFCTGSSGSLYAGVAGSNLSYHWRFNGQPLTDGPTPHGSVISGATTYHLSISNVRPEDAGAYDCVATNACSQVTSTTAAVTVVDCPAPCDPDVNCDGSVDGFDIEVMERSVGGDTTDFCQADMDFNRDGSVDGFDIEALEQVVGGAPCP